MPAKWTVILSQARPKFRSIQLKKNETSSQSLVLIYSSVYEMYILIINVIHDERLH